MLSHVSTPANLRNSRVCVAKRGFQHLQTPPTLFKHNLTSVGAFDQEGQKVQVGAGLENAHDVIYTSYKHGVVAGRARDSGWNACSPAFLVCHHVFYHVCYSSVRMSQGLILLTSREWYRCGEPGSDPSPRESSLGRKLSESDLVVSMSGNVLTFLLV